ncbi:MAG: polysaccharide ABC transporter ATP-binding protein [Bacteroidales bacterium]|nr:polysaccharide ABC transporter ATP-binding protein [Bacteroidales bacterium]
MKSAIRIDNVTKCYRLGRQATGRDNLSENLSATLRDSWRKVRRLLEPTAITPEESFWALKDVSFEVAPGEVVGIVGKNGAGKSTLLKILSRITEPTSGQIDLRGRLGSLLEVGTGFHPELSGRENIYLNGSILGMSRAEIRRKFDAIVAFSETEQFLDTPVKRYSSGMYVRLAFAVAAHLDPEILIVDEVLAVGDAAFQKKCLDKMRSVAQDGRTVLVVSHQTDVILRLCHRVVHLEQGRVLGLGDPKSVMANYLKESNRTIPLGERINLTTADRTGTGELRFTAMTCQTSSMNWVTTHGDITIDLEIVAQEDRTVDSIAISLYHTSGIRLVHADTINLCRSWNIRKGYNSLQFHINNLHLNPGQYQLGMHLSRRPHTVFDKILNAGMIVVAGTGGEHIKPQANNDGVVACDYSINEIEQPIIVQAEMLPT